MAGHGEKLTRKKEAAVVALLKHPTVRDAAAAVPVNEATLRRWLKDQAFRDEYRAARQTVLDETVAALVAARTDAVVTLQKNLDCGDRAVANRAAVAILEHSVKGVDATDFAERLDALERRLADMDSNARRKINAA